MSNKIMSKKNTLLENRRLVDAYVFVRHARDVISNYSDDPTYMPSKSEMERFRRIREDLADAAKLAAGIHERMAGRIEGKTHRAPPASPSE